MRARLRRGQRLGRYELLAPVGEGGMAQVWLARSHGSRGFEKLVALKTIKAQLADDALFERWFLDEARIAQRIFHTNVATTLDLGEEDGALFMVMEWVDGDSLSRVRSAYQRAAGTMLPVPIALRIVADMCRGLHAAHELRDEHGGPLHVVHRDVSPNNVLITGSGVVKLIDFGIATARDRTSPETMLGLVRGKTNYVAPEQIHRRTPLDRRCDVWAAGVCLYELLTGELPFGGADSDEIIKKILSATAPPAFDGDSGIDEILYRSLAPFPEDRFATASDMQQAIEAWMGMGGEVVATESELSAFLGRELPRLAEQRRAWLKDAIGASGETTASAVTPERTSARGRRSWLVFGGLGAAVVLGGGIWAAVAVSAPSPARGGGASPDKPAVVEETTPPPPNATPVMETVDSAAKKAAPSAATKKPPARRTTKAAPAASASPSPSKERDLGF